LSVLGSAMGTFRMFSDALAPNELCPFQLIRKDVDALFIARNKVAHTGANSTLKDTECLLWARTTRSLLVLGHSGLRIFYPVNQRPGGRGEW